MKGLVVGFSFVLPYHVMRCGAETGLSVHALGNGPTTGLRQSRFCAGYHVSAVDYASPDYDLAAREIRSLVCAEGIDVVFPSDDVSTRLLSAVKDEIGVRTAAVPTVDCFDLLNDKWNFNYLARANAVRVPDTQLYGCVDDLRRDLEAGSLELPLTIKPVDRSGAVGVHHIIREDDFDLLDKVEYSPVLAQRHIKGRDVGINVLCCHGRVIAHAVQERRHHSFRFLDNADLIANVERVARGSGLHGPANFDAILESHTGLGYILECNPRFWYTIYMSMALGLNFVEMSITLGNGEIPGSHVRDSASVRLNRALFLGLFKPWRQNRADWRMLGYHLADPVPYLCEKRSIYDDRHVAVHHLLMKRYQPARSTVRAVTEPAH